MPGDGQGQCEMNKTELKMRKVTEMSDEMMRRR